MAQNSDSSSPSLEGDDEESGDGSGSRKRKPSASGEGDGGSSKRTGRKSRSKSSKGDLSTAMKGSSTTKRTSRKSTDVSRQKKRKQTKKKSKRGKKSNALVTYKGNVQTSDEDTSLKGFSSSQVKLASKSASKPPVKSTTADESSLKKRIQQLESIVSSQVTEIQKLQRTVADMNRTVSTFSNVVDVLRDAGLQIDDDSAQIPYEQDAEEAMEERIKAATKDPVHRQSIMDAEIFGIAPTTVTE